MHRPHLLLGLLLLAALPLTAAPSRPNVLFIAVDDLRPQLGCYGDPVAITPHLDALAARGTLFNRAYAQQAVCNASRQSLLSGRRPDTIRVWDLKTTFRDTSPDVVSLPEYFKTHGYLARGIGKIFHDGMPDPRSWSVPAELEAIPKREDYRLEANRTPHKGSKAAATEFVDAPEDAYPDGRVASAAVAALETLARSPDQAFFLAVGIRKPHLPFTAPKKYWDLYEHVAIPAIAQADAPTGAPAIALHDSVELRGYSDQPEVGPWTPEQIATLRRGYYAATSFADAQIGRVLAALERTGLAKNTIVVVWGDHGYHLGEHGLWVKTTNYEADTRVPLIIATPNHAPARTEALVELIDLYPTLVDLCRLPPAAGLEGQSLAPNLCNPSAPGRVVAISQFPRPWVTGKPIASPQSMGYAARNATHRYVEWRDWATGDIQARELYALAQSGDFETTNFADRPEEAEHERKLAEWLPPAVAHGK